MPVKVKCPSCEKVLNAPDKARGKAVRCPQCKNPVRIPAAKKKKPAAGAGGFDDDDFLADLDLRGAEHDSARVCSRCGAETEPDEIECPACGADLATGQRASKKAKSKVNKKKFFKSVWSDSWSFMLRNKGSAIKTSIIITIFAFLALGCGFMAAWSSGLPPKAFWGFMGAVMILVPFGWPWFLAMHILTLTLNGKDRIKHLTFSMFDGVALGIKFIVWTVVFGAPVLALFGAGAYFAFEGGNQIGAAILGAVGVLIVWSMLPVAMAHMAMPVATPGWLIHRVLPGWGKSFFACFFVGFLILIVSLPVTGSLGAAGAAFGNRLAQVVRDINMNSQIDFANNFKDEESIPESHAGYKDRTKAEVQWNNVGIPMVLLAVACLFSGFPVVFGGRAIGYLAVSYRPVLDLNHLEKQVKYVKKKPKFDKDGNPIDASTTPPWLIWSAGTFGVIALYVVVNVVTYNFFDGLLILPRPIAKMLNLVGE